MKRYLFVYLFLLCHVTGSKAQSNTDAWFMHVYLRNGRCDNYALKEIDRMEEAFFKDYEVKTLAPEK